MCNVNDSEYARLLPEGHHLLRKAIAMPITTERSEKLANEVSPDKDEELEKFINTLVKGVSDEKEKSW